MVLMGLGMGLISTPATESILLVLPPARAGVGSAVNDATRELGGTLGVAVVGSLFSSVYAGHLADGAFGRLPGRALASAQDSVGAALGDRPAPTRAWSTALQDAFMAGLQHGLRRGRPALPGRRRGRARLAAGPRGRTAPRRAGRRDARRLRRGSGARRLSTAA